jgi:tRNA nucleotidyltransferase (CCA-adding enzyme)
MDIEMEVLSRIVPSEDENTQINKVAEDVKRLVIETAVSLGADVEPLLVGSVAKGTHLTNPDIDIFILFSASTERKQLEDYGLKIGRAVLENPEERYAEHPYIWGTFEGFVVEIVPCYKIKDPSQKMSAVDRTPFHTSYVMEHQKEEQKDQIRLFKQFLKGTGIYGAEAEIEGFSGYLCELMILHYGDFMKALTQGRDLKKGAVIRFDDRDHGKFNDPLVVIDPVDPTRNVASALSDENFAVFVHACREYLTNPGIEFFFPNQPKPESLDNLKQRMDVRGTTFLGIRFTAPETLSDILHSQLRKAVTAIEKECTRYGFEILDSHYFVNKNALLLFEYEVFILPSTKSHRGPPVWHPNSADFRAKWEDSENAKSRLYIKGGHWYVDVKREFMDARELLQAKLTSLNLGRHLNEVVKKSYELLVGDELLKEPHAIWLTMFLEKRFPWEY